MSIALSLPKMYTEIMEQKKKLKTQKATKKHRKLIRKEKRLTIRFTEQLHGALDERAYQENKTISAVVIEAVMKHLDFKMPPRD